MLLYSTTYTLLFKIAVYNSSNPTTQLLLNDEDWKDMRQNRVRGKKNGREKREPYNMYLSAVNVARCPGGNGKSEPVFVIKGVSDITPM